MSAHTIDRTIKDRIGAALYRLSTIERRATAAAESPKFAARLADDVRKLNGELERAFSDVDGLLTELARLQEAASTASRRAQLFFDTAPIPCVLMDLAGTIVDANEPAVRLLNVSRRHIAGRSFHVYLGGERELFLDRLRRLDQRPDADRWSTRLRPRERSVVEAVLTASMDPDGRVLMMVQPTAPGQVPHALMDAAVAAAPLTPDPH